MRLPAEACRNRLTRYWDWAYIARPLADIRFIAGCRLMRPIVDGSANTGDPRLRETDSQSQPVARGLAGQGLGQHERIGVHIMLHYTLVFFIIAIIAAALGFGGIAAGAAGIAKILFFVFLIMALVSFVMSLGR